MATKVFCNIITPKIKAIAKELGISESYAETLTSVWNTENRSAAGPNTQDIKALIERGKKNNEDYFLAIPNYEGKDNSHNPNLPMLSMTPTGRIVINRLPNEKPMDYFFSQLEEDNAKHPNKHNLDTIRKYVASPLEAYQYLLWRAQVSRQFNLQGNNSDSAFQTINSIVLEKIKKYREKYPAAQKQSVANNNTLNIYAGTNENADLSNFAKRPVTVDSPYNYGFATFETVEGAFQAAKLKYADINGETYMDFEDRLSKASGAEARGIGKTIPKLNTEKWDKASSSIMKEILKKSFEQNPQAAQRLLATGNATLTHTQDKGKWGTEFPKLLMEVREELRQSNTTSQSASKLSTYTNYSGAAKGADTEWANIGKEFGLGKQVDYTTKDMDNPRLTEESKNEIENAYQEAVKFLGRKALPADSYAGKLVRRDYLQAKAADAIFAVSTITNNKVDGGTGYAVTMAINMNKPVHVYDQVKKQWYNWDYNTNTFKEEETPILTPKFAGIGTRGINDSGKEAIRDVFEKTINSSVSPQEKVEQAQATHKEAPQPKSITYVDKSTLAGALAKTDANNNIRIAKNFGIREFYDYIQGKLSSKTSEQKKKVFEMLAERGYTITELGNLITTVEDAQKFLENHERSHVAHNDRANYWEPEIDGKKLEHKNYLTPHKLEIEARATQEAWDKLRQDKQYKQDKNMETTTINEVQDPSIMPKAGLDSIDTASTSTRAELSREFGSVERNNRINMIANKFSEIVDALVDEKISDCEDALAQAQAANDPEGIARFTRLIKLYKDEDNGRKKVIEDVTVEKIVDEMLEKYNTLSQVAPDDYTKQAYAKVVKYFKPLLEEAMVTVEHNENIRIIIEKHDSYTTEGQSTKVIGGTVQEGTEKEDNDDSDNGDDEGGKRADANGGWSYKIRQTNPMPTSRQIRNLISHIPKEGIDGTPEVDDLGNVKNIPENYAYSVLINELSKSLIVPTDFATRNDDGSYNLVALEKIARKYPWVNQLISALEMEPRLVAQFYTNFRKDFISYWAQKQVGDAETGVIKNICFPLNSSQALISTLNDVTNNYEMGTVLDPESIYSTSNQISKTNAATGVELMDKILPLFQEAEDEDIDTIVDDLVKGLRMLGFNTSKSIIRNLTYDLEGLAQARQVANLMKSLFSSVANTENINHLVNDNRDIYRNIAKIVGEVSELDSIQSFRQDDKTFYSFSAPNYIDTTIKWLTSPRFQEFINENFKKFPEFYKEGKWRNEWLRLLESDEDIRFQIASKDMNFIDGIDYEKWNTAQIYRGFINEYFSIPIDSKAKHQFANYAFPIFSDSPIAKFIKFKRYTGNFKAQLLPLLRQVVKQEIARITRVNKRAEVGVTPIANYDKHGKKFCFFPGLNNRTFETANDETISFYDKCQEYINAKDSTGLNQFIDEIMSEEMENDFRTFLDECSPYIESIDEMLINNEVKSETDNIVNYIEEFFWNNTFAQAEIIQLVTTDLAFYKDDNGVDFQKRFKWGYAAGNKLFTLSEYGRDTERTIILADEIITSSAFGSIQEVLEEAVKRGNIEPRDAEVILNKFKNINVADAQAYRSLSSYRSVLDMMGLWTDEMQETFDRIEKGEWTMADFDTVYQTLKPFVGTQLTKPDGLGGIMKVPMMNKNSEAVLLAMYPMIAMSMNKSGKLKAINRFMEEHNIDVIQYESAVKVGKQLVVDLSYSPTKLQTVIDSNPNLAKAIQGKKGSTIERVKEVLDEQLENKLMTQKEYNKFFNSIQMSEDEVYEILKSRAYKDGKFNPEVVHEISYNDYMIQQPTPEHLFDVEAIFGSQFRNLLTSDIPNDLVITVNGKDYTKAELISLYQSIITENLLDSFQEVSEKFTNIEVLQQALLQQVKGNPKYGREMLSALELVDIVNPNTGVTEKVFNIPLDNPSTKDKMQELMNAMFKNKITKQYIKGGNCILASSVGLTKELNLVYDKDNNFVGAECYLPAYSRKFFEPLMVEKTASDGSTYMELDINKLPNNLKKFVGYRIPTEGKYSMLPLIIKGFLPQQNGSAIMVPADITQIAGSDFDVDKMFLMLPEFKIDNYDMRKARELYARENKLMESLTKIFNNSDLMADLSEEDPQSFKEWFKENKDNPSYNLKYDTPRVRKIGYSKERGPQGNSRAARNNMIIDIAFSILTNKDTRSKIMHPGNYDKVSRASALSVITDNPMLLEELMTEKGLNSKTVADFLLNEKDCTLEYLDNFIKNHPVQRNPLSLSTFAHFHKQNMVGGMLIGIYANSTTAQAKFQGTGLGIKTAFQFEINGRRVDSLHDIKSKTGELISQNCAEFSAASVDNGKDPKLANIRQTIETAKVTNVLTRAGLNIQEIGLLFSSPVVKYYVDSTGALNGLTDIIKKPENPENPSIIIDMEEQLQALGALDVVNSYNKKKPKFVQLDSKTILNLTVNKPQFDLAELVRDWEEVQGGKVNPESLMSKYPDGITIARNEAVEWLTNNLDVAYVMNNMLSVSQDLNDVTSVSRADSPNGAISPSLAGAINQVHKVSALHRKANTSNFTLVGIDDVINSAVINPSMSIDEMREKLLNSRMPMLQSFFSLGIDMGVQMAAPYYMLGSDYINKKLELMYINAPGSKLSDDMLLTFDRELTTFALSKSELFGDEHLEDGSINPDRTYDKKREYYLYDYPAEFIKTINDNPDLRKIGVIKKLRVNNGVIEFSNSGRVTPMLRDLFIRDFDQLMYDEENPTAQQLVIDLFMYSYYHDGLRFGPNSFGRFFSTDFLTKFPGYINTLRESKYNLYEGSYFDKFLKQFYSTHYRESIVPKKSVSRGFTGLNIRAVEDDTVLVNFFTAKNRNYDDSSYEVYSFLYIKGDESTGVTGGLYVLDKARSGQGKADRCYVRVSDITIDNYPRYNANQTAEEMSEFNLDSNKVAKNNAIGRRENYEDSMDFIENDPFAGMNDVDFEAFEGIDGAFDEALGNLEDYNEDEANAQLDAPICPPK